MRSSRALLAALALAGCVSTPPPPKPASAPQVKTVTTARYEPIDFAQLPALQDADVRAAWPALLATCGVFERRAEQRARWARLCAAAAKARDAAAMRRALADHLDAYRVLLETREAGDGEARVLESTDRGRLTGYYEPLLAGSRTRDERYAVPLYRVPDDLLIVDLGSLYPELAGKRVRGRLVADGRERRVVPYWSRGEIDGDARLRGQELLWVDDTIEAFFLHVQGSGRVRLPDGSVVRVGYADTNGHPYRSIGAWLIERGELTLEQASMQGIAAWARAHPHRLRELLDANPSYVFFRELPLGDPDAGPVGALGVALTAGVSVAADPQFVPAGAPLVIRSEHPTSGAPLVRLVLAQDTGGAIRGPLRFDLFWGSGRAAGELAGRQRHDVQAWLLVPKGVRPEQLLR